MPQEQKDHKDLLENGEKMFTSERVRWAVVNLVPYKALEEDGMYPMLLQDRIEVLFGTFTKIFRSSLALGCQ